MNVIEAMEARHSVRSYQNKPIEEEKRKALEELARKCNAESGLNIQLCFDEEEAFQGMMAHYGKFHNVRNYIALVGKKDARLDETCGYYGEQLVLKATELGLSTCWVAMTDRKRRTGCVIALGYGENEGVPHKSKRIEEVCDVEGEMPAWFAQGVRCALLAPTAMNPSRSFALRFETGVYRCVRRLDLTQRWISGSSAVISRLAQARETGSGQRMNAEKRSFQI